MQLWQSGALEAVVSEFLFSELVRVLPRMNARRNWRAQEQRDYVELMRFLCEVVKPAVIESVRDKYDIPVLGTLIAVQAEYLITGDKDLLVFADRYPVVTPEQFLARHGD